MKNLTGAFILAVVIFFCFVMTASAQEPVAPSAPGVYALVGENYVQIIAPAISRELNVGLFGASSGYFISGKSAEVKFETSRPSFLVVLASPDFKGKYDDPHTWDLVLTNQKENSREIPMKKGTKYMIGEADYPPAVEKNSPLVFKISATVDLSAGEYFLLTGYDQKTKLATGYDFGIVKK